MSRWESDDANVIPGAFVLVGCVLVVVVVVVITSVVLGGDRDVVLGGRGMVVDDFCESAKTWASLAC